MGAQVDIVMLGICAWDYLGTVSRIPLNDKARMIEHLEQGGGPAGTAAVAASRLGARTGFIGKVGDDARGRLILDGFRQEGVDASGCVVQQGAISPAAFCWVEQSTGNRSVAWHPGSITPLRPEEVPQDLVRGARVLHLDGHQAGAAVAAAERARQAGATVSLDAGAYHQHMDRLMELSHVVIASEAFGRELIGSDNPEAAVREIFSCGPRIAMVTLGSRGSLCLTSAGLLHKPAFTVDVVDTTGAGDVFHGAFCVGMLEGWDLDRTIDFASAAAALKCRRLGGRTGILPRAEVIDFLKTVRGLGRATEPRA